MCYQLPIQQMVIHYIFRLLCFFCKTPQQNALSALWTVKMREHHLQLPSLDIRFLFPKLTYSKVWQQVNPVCLSKTRNLQRSRPMIHDCMQWHTSSPPSGAPSPGPKSTTTTSRGPAASSRRQKPPFSRLGKTKERDGKKSNRTQISGRHSVISSNTIPSNIELWRLHAQDHSKL